MRKENSHAGGCAFRYFMYIDRSRVPFRCTPRHAFHHYCHDSRRDLVARIGANAFDVGIGGEIIADNKVMHEQQWYGKVLYYYL